MSDELELIGKTTAREQHWQTFLAIVGTLISAGILSAVGLMIRTSERVIESTTKFEVQITATSQAMEKFSERLDAIDKSLANHETRITVSEMHRQEQLRASHALQTERKRPNTGSNE